VLRGLHFQKNFPQAKLVRVVAGAVYDVAVDLRKGSPTYGKWFGIVLSAENKQQLFIPRGFAHGFLTLADETEFLYKCDEFYHPEDEEGILWNDEMLHIDWEKYIDIHNLTISWKDQHHKKFDKEKFYFGYKELTGNTYVHIDMQHVWQSLKSNWRIDWKRLFLYLRNKFKITKVYFSPEYVMRNKNFMKNYFHDDIILYVKKQE
jgi:dTDP-4-dehydrorhamnose 3,5-epimerase